MGTFGLYPLKGSACGRGARLTRAGCPVGGGAIADVPEAEDCSRVRGEPAGAAGGLLGGSGGLGDRGRFDAPGGPAPPMAPVGRAL